jgi:hypothetical protein
MRTGPLLSLLTLTLAAGACASAAPRHFPAAPTDSEFAAMLARGRPTSPMVRGLHCDFIAEEGSEWDCRYEEQASSGGWVQLATYIAVDGDGWSPIDDVCTADQAVADRGRCRRE